MIWAPPGNSLECLLFCPHVLQHQQNKLDLIRGGVKTDLCLFLHNVAKFCAKCANAQFCRMCKILHMLHKFAHFAQNFEFSLSIYITLSYLFAICGLQFCECASFTAVHISFTAGYHIFRVCELAQIAGSKTFNTLRVIKMESCLR